MLPELIRRSEKIVHSLNRKEILKGFTVDFSYNDSVSFQITNNVILSDDEVTLDYQKDSLLLLISDR